MENATMESGFSEITTLGERAAASCREVATLFDRLASPADPDPQPAGLEENSRE